MGLILLDSTKIENILLEQYIKNFNNLIEELYDKYKNYKIEDLYKDDNII